MTYRWSRSFGASLLTVVWILAPLARARAADFIRGDANGDGAVTIADAYVIFDWTMGGCCELPDGSRFDLCQDAIDINDDGKLVVLDELPLLSFLFGPNGPPPPPYPEPGPDLTLDRDDLTCESYGGGSPLADPAAELRILDAYTPGGGDGHAVVTVALSSSVRVAAYTGRVRDEARILAPHALPWLEASTDPEGGVLRDLTGVFYRAAESPKFGLVRAGVEDGTLYFDYLTTYGYWHQRDGIYPAEDVVPLGLDVPVLSFTVCLKAGVPAGEYPLTLEVGELVAADSGRSIHPRLVSGTLAVLSGVDATGCVVDPANPPVGPNVLFKLANQTVSRGDAFEVPFSIRADRASQGFSYSIDFDEELLQFMGHRRLWERSGGTPYEFEIHEFDTENRVPGSSGIDEGFLVGAAVISLTDAEDVLPPYRDVEVIDFQFRASDGAPVTRTQIAFQDGAQGSGEPVANRLIARGEYMTPDAANSFVFINAAIDIIADFPFYRGDGNFDGDVDISDPITVLEHLFLGRPEPPCEDAADANDDGRLDISDGITIFNYLFMGSARIAPPFPLCGHDPTRSDSLGCGRPGPGPCGP